MRKPRIRVDRLLIILLLWAFSLMEGLISTRSAVAANADTRSAWNLITWGVNAPEWNRRLHVSALRIGCSSAPLGCLTELMPLLESQNVNSLLLAIRLQQGPSNYGEEYGRLARNNQLFREISIDDFASQYEKLFARGASFGEQPYSVLENMIDGAKYPGGGLKFGITLYEDDLDSKYLTDRLLPASVRQKIDFVHLYVHYRANGPDLERFVTAAKALFPRAAIIAGVYAYDRISYQPCAQRRGSLCTEQQEMQLFAAHLDEALRLFQAKTVVGIEFYPGQFGTEDAWKGWSDPTICPPDRRRACVENTKAMRRIVAERFARLNNDQR